VSETTTPEYARLRRGFTVGIIATLATMVVLGVVIHFANVGHHRPEGAAERWLTAVGDTTRKGVKKDALERTEEIGPFAVGKVLLPTVDTGGKAGFPDLEVGKARITGAQARVPYHLHQWAESGDGPVRQGVVVLQRQPDEHWRVTALGDRRPDEKVPSEGGAPPSSAPLGVWLGGAVFGLLLTVAISALVNWASRSARSVPATAS
jgi:hypothetical protein